LDEHVVQQEEEEEEEAGISSMNHEKNKEKQPSAGQEECKEVS
jgi:hypothetical protein